MKYEEDTYTLSTGRTFYANCGILGIAPVRGGERQTISHGYDGGVAADFTCDDEGFTPEERKEIAEYMIALWREWADAPR